MWVPVPLKSLKLIADLTISLRNIRNPFFHTFLKEEIHHVCIWNRFNFNQKLVHSNNDFGVTHNFLRYCFLIFETRQLTIKHHILIANRDDLSSFSFESPFQTWRTCLYYLSSIFKPSINYKPFLYFVMLLETF